MGSGPVPRGYSTVPQVGIRAYHNIDVLMTHHNSVILALLKPPFHRLALLLTGTAIRKKTPEINELDRDKKS